MKLAIDIYGEVTEIEVLRTYVKKLDTKVSASIICTSGKSSGSSHEQVSARYEAAERLARDYDMRILGSGDIAPFLDSILMKKQNGQ